MSETITLPNGDEVIVNSGRSLQFYIGDLYKYKIMDTETIITAGGKYIPKVNDMVYDFEGGYYRVSYVDTTTYIASLSEWYPSTDEPEVTEEDKFLASGSGYQSESWRVYLDTRTLPYRLEVDEGFRTYGNKSEFIRIYRGVNTSETGEIISAYYNGIGEYVGDQIPLDVVANVTDSMFSPNAEIVNIAIKAPAIGYTTKDLSEGEYVTIVAYQQDGTPVRSARCIVHKTNVYGRVEDTQKRVTSIQLISSFLSETETNTLMVPLNINVAALALRAKVNYSDGTSLTMDVGDETSGSKFMLYGIKYWSPTIAGAPTKTLTLVYRMSPSEEYSRAEGESENGLITEKYQIVATDIDPSLSLKLFVYPTWNAGNNAYGLDYWLFDLQRLQYYKVPSTSIEFDTNSRVFDGADYTSVQTMTVGVVMGDLDSSYGTYRHVQIVQVALLRSGGLRATNWRVRHSTNQESWYGDNKEAVVTAGSAESFIFDISCGYTDYEEWLNAIYYANEPLYDPTSEAAAPAPTHFILHTGNYEFDYPMEMWNKEITVLSSLTEGKAVGIRFVNRTVNGELQLATVGMPIHNV